MYSTRFHCDARRCVKLKGVALEMGRRMWTEPLQDRPLVRSPADAAGLLLPEMSGLQQEQMRVMLLDTKNRVLGIPMIYQGSSHTTVIRVGELLREAVRNNAAAVIIAHNHPSSDPSPSPEDLTCNREIVQAGKLLDCDVVDHLIIRHGGLHNWISMKERGLDSDQFKATAVRSTLHALHG